MLIDELKKYKSFVIYGAQVIAVGAYTAIKHLTGRSPECFAVGKPAGKTWFPTGNPEEIDGIPVVPIDTVAKDTFVVLGVTELIQQEAIPYLDSHGYKNYYPLTQHEEHLLMSEYYAAIGRFLTVEKAGDRGGRTVDPQTEEASPKGSDFVLYEVKNDRDKPLENHPELFIFEKTIQAGAALTGKRISDLTDDTGMNISERNRMYCEMSAVYWVWKNTEHDWVGIEHYRRHLLVRPEMLTEDVDAILPLPYTCYPNEMAQFLRFTTEDVLNALLKTLKELHPSEFARYHDILYGKYQYTYNLVCAKRKVFDDYCRWFFEITEHMETMADEVPEIKETRALSYVAEVLTNLYFMDHQKDLRILHVEKAIYT